MPTPNGMTNEDAIGEANKVKQVVVKVVVQGEERPQGDGDVPTGQAQGRARCRTGIKQQHDKVRLPEFTYFPTHVLCFSNTYF